VVVLTLSDQRPDEIADFLQKMAPDTFNGSVESYGWLAIRDFRPWSVVVDRAGNLRDYVFGMQDFESFEKKVLDCYRPTAPPFNLIRTEPAADHPQRVVEGLPTIRPLS
jgi:hypothetical protein